MRILQIESDAAESQSQELALKSEGFMVYTTDLGEEGIEFARSSEYDLIILEVNLSDMYGLDVLKALRRAKNPTPVMFVSKDKDVETRIKAFEAGADEFLVKPFHKDELVARIKAVTRRPRVLASSVITIGNLQVDLPSRQVTIDEDLVHCTPKEYLTLKTLILKKGKLVRYEWLLGQLYETQENLNFKLAGTWVFRLRKILKDNHATVYIKTVREQGYILQEESGAA